MMDEDDLDIWVMFMPTAMQAVVQTHANIIAAKAAAIIPSLSTIDMDARMMAVMAGDIADEMVKQFNRRKGT